MKRTTLTTASHRIPEVVADTSSSWLDVVAENVAATRFGVLQIVIHDGKVVQIERTERTRFEPPRATR